MDFDIENRVKGLIEPVVLDLGFELVQVEYVQAYGSWVLRLYIDKPGGITIEEITRVSRETSTLLDVEDFMPKRYSLEVSSPGLDRPLVKPEHFLAEIGKLAQIKTKAPVDGRKKFKGVIESFADGQVTVKDNEDNIFIIDIENIDKARLEIVFD
jgi:ribosome maturation factor RimP